jgi:hypothetical protein
MATHADVEAALRFALRQNAQKAARLKFPSSRHA